jgi:hypothetical protein
MFTESVPEDRRSSVLDRRIGGTPQAPREAALPPAETTLHARVASGEVHHGAHHQRDLHAHFDAVVTDGLTPLRFRPGRPTADLWRVDWLEAGAVAV